MSAVVHASSPRTLARPMAFTGQEFVRGAFAAWGSFLILSTCLYALIFGLYVVMALFFIVPWSAGGFLVGMPFAYGLGMSLRNVRSRWVHVSAFAVLGAIIGATTTAVASAFMGDVVSMQMWVYNVPLSAVAVPLGWWWSVRRAVASDAASSHAAPGKSDSAFEASL